MKINIVNVSGGVDSTACYLLALERGEPFRATFADTGNEHELTLEYVNTLAAKTGGPEVKVVRADFRQRISVRRMKLERMQESGEYRPGWTPDAVGRVLKNLTPTGTPFLDMVLEASGRFPGSVSRFCTAKLKLEAMRRGMTEPAIAEAIAAGGQPGDVITWVGIRRDESPARANAEEWSRESNGSLVYRPLVDWTKQQCFDLLKKHGVEPNPLYKLGCSRVGCMPCIMASKNEIRMIAKRWPRHIDKIREWERLAGLCSKKGEGSATFFHASTVPGTGDTRANIDTVVDWSMTRRGGIQYDMFAMEEPPACSSLYGLCE